MVMQSVAQVGLILILSLTIAFHLLVITKIIPYSIVWGGRLKTDAEMYRFEIVSLLVNVILLILVLMKSDYLTTGLSQQTLKGLFWAMAALFLFNTVGNISSRNKLER